MIRLKTLGSVGVSDDRGHAADAVVSQSKRFAILVYLALAEPGTWHRRDTILAQFWPDLDQARGRHALRQALHFLRRQLGDGIILTRGSEDVAAGPDLWCDAAAFEAGAEPGEALELYRGDFLCGFYVRDAAPEFDRWIDQRRTALRTRALAACEQLARRRRAAGDLDDAIGWARRATGLASLDEGAGRRLAELLAEAGRTDEGLRELDALAARLREDLEVTPAPATSDLADRLRRGAGPAGPRPVPAALPAPSRPAPRRWLRVAVLGLGLALAGAALSPELAPDRSTAHSALADSLYRRGLVTLDERSDSRAALGWFEAALQASPRFAMAAYYAGVSASGFDGGAADRWFARAAALAPTATEHDRLVIETAIAFRGDDPAALAAAESLVTRYDADPLAHHLLGSSLLWSGDFTGALREFRAEAALEPLRHPGGACGPCQAFDGMAVAFQFSDSFEAAERMAREEVRLAPRSLTAWSTLATMETDRARYAEARAARRRAADLTPGQPGDPLGVAELSLRAGDFVTADRLLRGAYEVGSAAGKNDALWMLVISLRNQGRLHEALAAARAYRRQAPDTLAPSLEAVPEAQVLLELGDVPAALALFDSIAAPPALAGSRGPRGWCWAWLHEGEAAAAAGDTTRVLALADSIERTAVRSLYGRDRHLPDHLRGLVWLARGRADSALAHLAAAVFSPTNGYSRTNYALGRALLAAGRPGQAAGAARAGLAGAIDGSAYYVTRTELHELAAQAFDAAGEPDSAAAQYEQVVRAWARADPVFAARLAAARARLAVLQTRERHGLD